MIAARNPVPAEPEVILYTNHRGETAVRRIRLDVIAHGNEAVGFGFGSTEWHSGEQLLFSAFDVDKGARRTFAMAGVKAWGKEAVAAALTSSSGEALRAIRFATKYIDDHWDRAEFFEAFLHGELTEWPEFTSSAPPVVAAETFATIAAWAEATFGPITPERTVARADEEMVELRAEPASVEEAADVVICLARYANLWAAVERKMAVNRKRQWRRVGDGTGYHIKVSSIAPFRAGDHVLHGPSGETWVVAWADPVTGDLAWCGWPDGVGRMSDCTLAKAASDAEHQQKLRELKASGGSRAATAVRLYGEPAEA